MGRLKRSLFYFAPADDGGGGAPGSGPDPALEAAPETGSETAPETGSAPAAGQLTEEQLGQSFQVDGTEMTLGDMVAKAQQASRLEQQVANLSTREDTLNQLDAQLRLREAKLARESAPAEPPDQVPDPEQDPKGYFRHEYVDPVFKPLKQQLEAVVGELRELRPAKDVALLKQQFVDYDQFEPVIEQALTAIRQQNPVVAESMNNVLGRELLYHRAKMYGGQKARPAAKPTHNTQVSLGRSRVEEGINTGNRGERARSIIQGMPRAEFEQYRAALEAGKTAQAVKILNDAGAKLGTS